jgi:hypothetical protein
MRKLPCNAEFSGDRLDDREHSGDMEDEPRLSHGKCQMAGHRPLRSTWQRGVGGGRDRRGTTSYIRCGSPLHARCLLSSSGRILRSQLRSPSPNVGSRAECTVRTFRPPRMSGLCCSLAMPEQLVHAHDLLDRAVITVFAGRRQLALASDQLGVLFEHYEDWRSPMLAAVRTTKARRTRH